MPSQIMMFSNGGAFTAVSNPAASFAGLSGGGAFATSEAVVQFEAPMAGRISGLYVRADGNTSAVDQVVTVRVNSGPTAVTTTVTAGVAGVYTDLVNSVNVTAGQLISIGITSGAGAGSVTYSIFSVIFTSNVANTAVQLANSRSGGGAVVSSGSSRFVALTGVQWSGESAPTSAAWILRTGADFSYLRTYLMLNTNTSAGATVALYVDGADTALSAAIGLTSGEFLNTATTVTVAAGSSVTFRYTNPNTGNGASSYQYILTQVTRTGTSANSAWSNIGVNYVTGASGIAITSRTATLYFPLGGGGTSGQTSEGTVQATARGRFRIQNMQVNIPTNGAGTSIKLRVNSSNAITLALTSGQVGIFLDSTAGPTVTSTDLLNWAMDCTAGTGGWTLAGITAEMMSIDSIPQRTLVGAGI